MTIFRIEGSSSYEYVAGSYTYDQALAGAQAAGGWLLTIETAAEGTAIANWLASTTGTNGNVWQAISDAAGEGVWRYTAGPNAGQEATYTNWAAGEPNNVGDEDHASLFFQSGAPNHAQWADAQATNLFLQRGYVIERSAGLVGTSGADTLIGGPGSDTADYGGAGDAIHVRTTTTLSLAALPASAQLAGVGFTDVTTSAGVLVAGSTRASAWGDHDGDGDLDLFVVDQGGGYFLFSNAGDGTFIDATTAAGISGVAYSNAAAWGDYDGDGDLDLFVATGHGDPDVLYRNDGNGRFANVADAAGLRGSTVAYSASGAAWGDYDGDLDLDLHVVNHAGEDILYRNDGTGTFTNVSLSAAIVDTGAGAQSSWIDYDDDGDLDLYVTTIYGDPNVLYRNEGNGVFVNVTAAAGVVGQGETTGIAWGDYDGDGDFDLYAPNTEGTGVLYRNEGDGHFVDVTLAAGVPGAAMAGGGGTSAGWGDFDADGDLDLYVANYYAPNIFYLNDGDGTFTDATAAYSVGDVGLSHSIALGDYDGDGDLDIHVASHGSTDPNVLYRNNANPSGATMLRVDSRVEGAPAIAATLRLMLGDTVVATRLSGHSDGFGQSLGPVSFFALDPDESYTLRTTYSDGVTLDTVLGTPTERAGRLLTVDRVRLATGADIGTDTLRGIEHVVGGAGDDMLVGTRAGDTLAGGIGDDTLSGGAGNDRLEGGSGRDTADYGYLSSGLTATVASTGTATVVAGPGDTDVLVGIEGLAGGAGADVLVGDGASNVLSGGAGDDTLDGRGGDDRLVGGAGDDTYFVDSASDVVVEEASGGIDTVISSRSHSLASNIENMVLAEPSSPASLPPSVLSGSVSYIAWMQAAAPLAGGGHVSAWSEFSGGAYLTRFQLHDASGSAVGPVRTLDSLNQWFPAVTSVEGGGFALAWNRGPSPDQYEVVTQFFSSSGDAIAPASVLAGWPPAHFASLTATSDGVLCAWTTTGGVYVAAGTASGGFGEARLIATSPGTEWRPTITSLTPDLHVVGWGEFVNGRQYVALVDASGRAVGAPVGLASFGNDCGVSALGPTHFAAVDLVSASNSFSLASVEAGVITISQVNLGPDVRAIVGLLGRPEEGDFLAFYMKPGASGVFVRPYTLEGDPAGTEVLVPGAMPGNHGMFSAFISEDGTLVTTWPDASGRVTTASVGMAELGLASSSAIGNELDNVIAGNDRANVIDGREGDDTLSGGRGDDTLRGEGGDDTLSGGDGVDMAAYALARANYSLLNDGSGTIAVMALAGGEGLDTVLGVETLRFADGDVSVAGLPIGDAGAVSVAGVMALRAAGFQGPWSYAVSDSAEVLSALENTQVVAGARAVVVEGVASVLQAAAIVSASAPGTDVDYVIFDDVPSILAIGGFAALPGFPLPANRPLLVDATDVRIADGQVLDGGTAANLASVGVSLAASTAFLGIHGDGDSLAVGQIRDYLSMIAGFGTSLGAVRYGVSDSASTIVDPANLDVIRGANKLVVTGRATVQEVQAINAIATSAVSISYDASAEASGVTIALGDGASVVAQADGASIVGSAFGDTLFGGSGDDVMEGGGGDDTLSGGDGADIATYALLRASYDISLDASGVLTVRALSGSEGTDTLTGIETLRFSDGDFLASPVAMPGTYFSGSIAVSPALGSGDNVVSSNYLQVGLNAPGSLQVVGKSLQVNTSRGGAVDIGRSNNGLASEGSLALQNGASLQISGIPSVPSPSAFVYMNANMQVGRNVNGIGDMEVSGAGTSLSMSGYGAFVEVGRESGVGNVTISAGAHVAIEGHRQLVAGNLVADENFSSLVQLVIARNTGGSTSAASVGNVEITGTGTSLAISADTGADIAIGRANGGGRIANGTLTISGGADVLLSSDPTAEGADWFSASSLTVGRGIGGEGHAVITGPGTSFVAEGHVARINIARPDNSLYYEILGSGRGTLVIDGGASVVLRATPDPDKVTGEKSVAGNVVSGALDFDGAGSRVEIADPGASRLDVSSGMTLELFLEGKPYDVTGSSMTLASKGAAWSVVLDTRGTASLSDDVLVFSAGSGTGATLSVAAGQFFDGFAHSAAMAYDGTARTFRVLRDGAQVASQSGITGGAIASNDDPILIGGTGSTGFSGTIDEVRLWSKARSNDAINAYWLNDVATSVERSAYLVGHWKFDEASGTTVLDSSGNGFSGVVHGAAARTAIGRWDDDGGDDSSANIVVGRGKSADGDLSIAGAGTQVELSGHQASLTIGTMGGAGSATVSGGAVLSLASTPSALMPDYWSGTVVDVGRARGYLDGVASQGEFTIQGAGTRVELTGHQASFHVGRERKDLVLDLDGGTGTLVVEAGAQLRLDAQGAADRIDPANPDHWSGSQLVIGRGANGWGSATIRDAGTTVTLEGHEVHVWVGDEGGTGTLQLDTGATLVMDAVAEAGRAASRTGAWMVVGDGAGSTGGLSLDGVGTRLSIHGAASLLAIGVAGDGEVVVSGGATIGLDASGVVALAGATGSSARLEITGDGSSLSAGTLVAGMRFEDAPVAFDRSLAVASGGAAEISLSGGGELRVAESWLLANARLGGEGRLVGDLSNLGGEVGPGAGIGNLVVDGDYLQEGSGILRLDLSASANDLLEVTGAARFEDGVIDLDYASLAGIDPAHRFVLARATGGIFLSASVEIRDLPTGYALRVEDGGSTLVLALDPPLELLPLSVADGIATFEVVLKGGYTIDAADLVLHVDPAAGTFQGFDAPGADLADTDATTGGDLSAGMAWLEPVGGADPARLATVAYTLVGGARSLELSMVSGILGFVSGGADTEIMPAAAASVILGTDGDDTLASAAGNDLVDGGAGAADWVSYAGAAAPVIVALASGSAQGGAGKDILVGIENVAGGAFADTLAGDAGANQLSGAGGDDTLIGGAGDDTLAGGDGSDVATYALARSSYGVSRDAFGTIVVEALSGAEGIDTLSGVERLRFADGDMIDFAAPTLAANGVTVSENGTTVTLVFDEDLSPVGAAWSAFTVTVNGVAALVASASVSGNTVTLTMARPIAQGTTVTVGYVDPAGDQASGVLQDVAGNDAAACSNVPATNNSIVDPSATLSGIAYHWKSHALLGSVSVVARGDGTGDGGPSPLSLRGHRFDANGDLVAEVWMDGGAGVENAGFELSSDGGAALSWTASEPSGWMVDTANEAGVLRVAMIGSTTVSGAVKLGTVVLDLPTGAEREVIRLLDGELGAAQVAGFATTVARGPTDGQGAYAVVELDHDGYCLSASRTTTDTGSAITSSDALAALKLAVGRNPNTDPDGSGPLVAPLVSPYQFIAADVTGDGRVTSSDALGILKMAVRRADAPARDWFMVREDADFWDEAAGKFTTTRTSVAWSRETQVDLQQDLAVNFVGVLKGDVNGSWKPLDAAGRPMADGTFAALSHAYFEDLERLTGAPIDQWGG